MTINEIADFLCKKLLDEGFVIQRYDAYSTNSIYLKLDYGVCNSIRISDHPGKKHLKYRYNIGPNITEYKEVKDRFPRYYYRADKLNNLIKKILKDRDLKKKRYGELAYQNYMKRNKQEKSGDRGFWRDARIVS